MTLLKLFINKYRIITKTIFKGGVVLLFVILSGCSIMTNTEHTTKNEQSEKRTNKQDLVRKDISSTHEKSKDSDTKQKKNLYAEQTSERLANVTADIITKYRKAIALMKQQQWQSAESLLDEVITAQPTLSGAFVNKALISVHQNNLAQAEKHLNKALNINPLNPYAHQLKGQVARLNGLFAKAEKSYLDALNIWPEYPEAQLNLAILLELYRGRLLDAKKYYTSYLVLQPDDKQAQRWLAGVEIKIKRAGLSFSEKTKDNVTSSLLLNRNKLI